ncbi:MAG: SRPBCC family protein [Candidatus Dormibacteraeota bacterium]|nr:SRPBCC family protein [Candidatus Dormibacteraeota bacterium]
MSTVGFEASVVIRRPAAQVFDFLANPENDPQWSSASKEMRKTSVGPVDVGATFTQVGHFLGRRFEFSLEVTANEPNRKFGMRVVAGPIRFAGVRVLETVPDGTRVTFTGAGASGGFFKLARPLLARAAERQLNADLAALKEVLEAQV